MWGLLQKAITQQISNQKTNIQSKNVLIFRNSLFFIKPYIGGGVMTMLKYLQLAQCQIGYRKKGNFSYLSFSFQTQLNSNITDNKVSNMVSQFSECKPWTILRIFLNILSNFRLVFFKNCFVKTESINLIKINTEISIVTIFMQFLSNIVNISW